MTTASMQWHKAAITSLGVLCFALAVARAQPTYTRDHLITALDVVTDAAGNSYVAGWTEGTVGDASFGKSDMFVAKYGPDGERQWIQQFGTAGWDDTKAVVTNSPEEITLITNSTGYTLTPGYSWGMAMVRLAQSGRPISIEPIETMTGYGITFSNDDHLYLAAFIHADSDRDLDAPVIVKLSYSGTVEWERSLIVGDEIRHPYHLDWDTSGFITVAGNAHTAPKITHPDQLWGFIARLTTDGQIQWNRAFPEPIEDIASNDVGTSYITGGGFFRLLDAEEEPYESNDRGVSASAFLASFDADGNTRWIKQFGGYHSYWGRGVAVDATGNVIVVGYGNGNIGGEPLGASDAFVIKYTQDGDRLWADRLGTPEFDRALAVTTDHQGNVYVAGFLGETWEDHNHHNGVSNDAGNRAFLVKYSPDGQQLWLRTLSNHTDTPTEN